MVGVTEHPVFTIGHSNHPLGKFIEWLRLHRIDEVVDVRSSPYSRYTPHFNTDALCNALGQVDLGYVFLGGQLGGRPADQSCYGADGRVRYDLLANTHLFDDGIRRVMYRADYHRIALMCTEKEPLECHRVLLVASTLYERGVEVQHILGGGSLEPHADTMDRLMDIFKLPRHGDLFRSRIEVIAEALTRQAQKVAYVGGQPPSRRGDRERVP